MNTKLLLLTISVAAFSSCTTLYKSGQTPDDVYYSPNRSYGEERNEDKKEGQRDEVKNYDTYGDRTIRLGINDRRFRNFDNDYGYNPYNYGFNTGYYYNPYFWPRPVFSPVFCTVPNTKNTTPRISNLGGYNNTTTTTYSTNPKTGTVKPTRNYNNSNNGSAVGNVIRQIFSPANNNNSNTNNSSNNNNSNNNSSSNTTRSYTPSSSSSSSSSSGSSSSGSGSVSRPPRGGGN